MDNIDRYDVDCKDIKLGAYIAGGSYGDVHKATWKKNFVVKEIRNLENSENSENFDKIFKEADNLKNCKHRHIVEFYGLAKSPENKIWILLEFADCGSLSDFLHRSTRQISFVGKLNWMLQIAKGMKYLHSKKVIHRDLKPGNLLLFDNYCTLKICDFGTVKQLATVNTECTGTFGYMAPEINITNGKYTEKCDVFSFGIVFWEVMSRMKPFHIYETDSKTNERRSSENQKTSIAIQNEIAEGKRPDLNDIKNYIGVDYVRKLIELCWHSEPEKRPSMEKLVVALSIDPRPIKNPELLNIIKPLRDFYEEHDFKG